jgi:prolyl oligopeptidase
MGFGLFAAVLTAFSLSAIHGGPGAQRVDYPEARRSDFQETLFGLTIKDPYRWMEDMNSSETLAWEKAENDVTFAYLHAIPGRQAILDRLTKLWNFEKYGIPSRVGNHLIYEKNDGLQNQSVTYVVDLPSGSPRILLDPNNLSKDGTVALSGTAASWDGKYMAYSISRAGSDWQEWRVRDIATGADLPDLIRWSKFSGASWSRDCSGFYYSAYDPPQEGQALNAANYFQKVYFHRLGTPQADDNLVYERKDHKEWLFDAIATEDGRYLLIQVSSGTNPESMWIYRDLRQKNGHFVDLLDKFDAAYDYLANNGAAMFFKTDKGAPTKRVVEIDLDRPEPAAWKTLIPARPEALDSATVVGNSLYASYLKDAVSRIYQYDLKGNQIREIALPGLGNAAGFGGLRRDRKTYYSYVSYLAPTTIFSLDLASGKSVVFKSPKVDFDPSQFESKEVFYPSKDGTKIPLFLTYKKGLKLDGTNPTLLYGYGGFDISMTPFFSVTRTIWMEMGGVSAVACIRGGGEYGRPWHDEGRLFNKQNVFDDFIAAGEYLIAQGYTSKSKLAIQGGSNGGLLIGACETQRPDLWGAALPQVGVMDMLRFNKFTIGWAWESDYGNPEKEADFKYLLTYSPYHNIKDGVKYPPTLITTSDHDDRVVPAHSFKYAAAMQHAQAGDAPILIRIETSAGHGAGTPTTKLLEESADWLAFLVKNLGVESR